MLFLHENYELAGTDRDALERLFRDRAINAVAADPGMRLCWYAESTPGSLRHPEVVTMTALEDGSSLARLAARRRDGDLRDLDSEVLALTRQRDSRVLVEFDFSPLHPSIANIPVEPVDHERHLFIQDFVRPRTGQHEAYVEMMRKVYMGLSADSLDSIVLWADFQPVVGGGEFREWVCLNKVQDFTAMARLMWFGNKPANEDLKSWMHEGLRTRDTWSNRFLRTSRWSPLT